MTRILIVHGLGVDMRGKTLIEIFGTMTLADYDAKIREYAGAFGVDVDIFHSNVEGEVIDRLELAEAEGFDGLIINPGGYMVGHPEITAAISALRIPVIEVHVTNPASRGTVSGVAGACAGTVAGFGIAGYALALRGLRDRLAP